MSNSSQKDRPGRIEIQKGPVSMEEQYSMSFPREPQRTLEDMQNNNKFSPKVFVAPEPKRKKTLNHY